MEWREQSTVSYDDAYVEAQRWVEAVTKKTFGSSDFRSALENGVLLCDLINKIKPGIVKRINRLPTPIAGLDNLNVFLRACDKLGLKEAQLFHPGDLQDLSTRVTVKAQETKRRLKNVLITLYWLGRRAQCDPVYDGPYLNLKAFEGLLGTALYKALEESSGQKDSSILRDSGFGDSWYSEQDLHHFRSRGGGGHRRDDSLDSLDSVGSRPHSISSDIKGSSEGFYSDTEADPVFRMADKDGLSYRRSVVVTPKTTTQFNQFLPTKDKATGYIPGPLRKKRAERNEEGRRSWTNPYTEEDTPLTRQDQRQDSIEGSESVSDILIDQSATRQVRYEELLKFREHIRESEDKWQDDLSKWKTRRKSVNSDIVKKKEEREKIEETTYGSNRRSKTFKEMQEERENRRQSVGSRLGSLSFMDDEDVFDKPVTTPRPLHTRSYTIDSYYSSSKYPESLKEDEPRAASPATGRAAIPTTLSETADTSSEVTIKSTSFGSYQRSPSPPVATQQSSLPYTSSVEAVKPTTTITTSSLNSIQRVPEPKNPLLASQTKAPSSQYKPPQQQQIPMEPKPPAVSQVSASLPRNYQRSDSAQLITPRPFGSQASRISSLQRSSTTDDSLNKPVNGDLDTSKKSSVPSRYHQVMTSEDEAQSSSAHSSEDEEEGEEQEQSTEKSVTLSKAAELKSADAVSPASVKDNSQENYCEMRISLNQKPNSSRDFGFQAAWDSTGARVTSIVPGSPAEMCQLQTGDEVMSVNGHQVADMSYTAWKSHMEEALQEGSLVMDVRRHGKNNWDRDEPSLPYKSHKTINLTSTDHPILLGAPDTNAVNSSLEFSSHISTKTEPVKEPITQPLVDVASNGVNGSPRKEPVTMRNKESEPISLKNLKRRSEFFEQGGTEPAMPDIPVPSITKSSSRWSWDPEEERRRQEKWQKEQERLLQEKYKRDQEKLQEEWLKAQQEITSTQGAVSLEVKSLSVSPHSPLSPAGQPLSSLWEEQERKRTEQQERQEQAEERELQRLQEERHKREQQLEEEERKRRDERLKREQQEEEERKRKEERLKREQQEEERKRREEQLRKEQQEEEERRRRREEALEQQRRERERAQEIQQQQWAKSKSSPQLDEEDTPQRKVVGSMVAQKGQTSASQAELERQQILKEMKKKTPLLTDGSWIRQRSSTTSSSTSRDNEVPPMRRGESLDNLDSTNYNSWRSSWTPRSNAQIPNYSRPQSALSGSTSFSGGWSGAPPRSSTLPSSSSLGSLRGGVGHPSAPWSRQTPSPSLSSLSPTTSPEPMQESQQRSRSVSGKKICTYCDSPLGKGAAMIIESLGLCYHLSCFKCSDCGTDLGGSEAGAEVRIRNKQLYCNSCYVRFKTSQPTSM